MFVGIGFIICMILAAIIGVRVGRNRRANGKGAIFSFVTGAFGAVVAGILLLIALAIIDISINGSDRETEASEPAVSEQSSSPDTSDDTSNTSESAAATNDGPKQFDDVIAMAEDFNDYPPEFNEFSVVDSDPLHIQLLPTVVEGDLNEVVHDTNWRAALYGAYNTFIHTDADHVIVDAIPRQYASLMDRDSPELLDDQKITLNLSRDEALEVVQSLIDVDSLEGLKARDPEWDFYGWTEDWNSIYYTEGDPGLDAFIDALEPYTQGGEISTNPTSAESAKSAEIEAGSDLGFDAKTFASRFNSAMADLGQPYRAEGNVDNSGVQGVFQEMFSEHLAVTGTVKPESGAVNGVIFMGTGDGTQESGARVMVVASGVVAATQPDMSVQNAFDVVMSLLQSYDGGEAVSNTLNGVKYTYQRSDMIGNMLSVDSAES
ncbi:hypothetical protein [Kushneria phyllosphaerae]|uniref:Uncharacterized protein n=1 Tax=Kushneria phyllosphaerae TaxID=2100822 RepID=A0A2R8CR20_9GAMM|nr:hypothetical protein [Kushneria phyllosphaerae]SPJ35233.1 hypothetical protein KSP9073_03291 [Kushneria phyllosphaerae]